MIEQTCEWASRVTNGRLVGTVSDRRLVFKGVSTDTRTMQPNQLYVPLVGERFDGHDFWRDAVDKGAAACLWQQDRPVPETAKVPFILVSDTLEALQAMASAYRDTWSIPVVAVTGSNGKTTTKDLIASVLSLRYRVHKTQGNLNNHIGVPLTLLSLPREAKAAVVEMGMNHKGEIALLSRIAKPDVAVITNIGESHLEHLGSRSAIADAKCEIGEGLAPNGTWVINGDEPLLLERVRRESRRVVKIGWGGDNDDRPESISLDGLSGISFTSAQTGARFSIPLLGRHNAVNALMAAAVGRLLGLSEEEIGRGLSEAQLTGMRLELRKTAKGMLIIDDTYNASPTSMRAAIDLLMELDEGKEKWVLLGDMMEIGAQEAAYHREIGRYAAEKGVSRVYTLGEKARWIGEGVTSANPTIPVRHFKTRSEAAQTLQEQGEPQVILLAKASRAVKLDEVVKDLTKGEKTD
ncbi:UDP-N-acetylmuramoyl-tripeptide--D-alanyl-D-alanine ligase [Polycladomyces subterraneus]|uniref:UDP-N-acetylmuramoyl-tripeptide--D-alanyl-D-alanine ligase n=1 Tax=Polycladomyces subterraneus TaxID=1016997 RepID=A0ABT8IQ90_9BACL|nr:UDP-N-acetylmuramoyl-tripeptide--D-alanyl-D-alanine ligase [Polycladomyces subterraneus]MDN4594966.1 UDP-N-acetylmuramoyl-tripeptide--D-alanyl-D-alanine ligase [Polycladomyces subterraneus]